MIIDIAYVDIETNGLNGFKADTAYVIAMGIADYKEGSRIRCLSLLDYKGWQKKPYDDKKLIHDIHKELSQYKILIGHYIKRFDWPFLQSRFRYYGLPRLRCLIIDTWEIYRNNFKLSSNRLAHIANAYSLSEKKMSKGNDWSIWWKRCAAGEVAALKFIVKYCKQDIATGLAIARHCRDYWPDAPIQRALMIQTSKWPKHLGKPNLKRADIDAEVVDRLCQYIHKPSGKYACWQWLGCLVKGYGQIYCTSENGKQKRRYVHRIMYELFKGQIKSDMTIDHICFNTKCTNPLHLQVLSNSDNVKRAYSAGRHYARKLTVQQVKQIRQLYKKGNGDRKLSKKFKVTRSTIYKVHKYLSYKWVK